jgi:hypothetical protein
MLYTQTAGMKPEGRGVVQMLREYDMSARAVARRPALRQTATEGAAAAYASSAMTMSDAMLAPPAAMPLRGAENQPGLLR